MKKFIITPKNDSLYFELFQNSKYDDYINPSLSKDNFPHFSVNFRSLKDYFLVGFHEDGEIGALGLLGYYHLNKGWAIPYINVHPEYKNKGLATQIFETFEELCPEKIRLSGFTTEGYLYLRPMLIRKGYEVANKVAYYPSDWTVQQMNEWDEKYLNK